MWQKDSAKQRETDFKILLQNLPAKKAQQEKMSKTFAEKMIEVLNKRGIKPFHVCEIKKRRCKDLEKFLKHLERMKKLPIPNMKFKAFA